MSNPNSSTSDERLRKESYGEGRRLTVVDRFGVWLSARRIRRVTGDFHGLRVADIGCGYHATFVQSILEQVRSALVVDVTISPALKSHPKIRAIEGALPGVLQTIESESQDLLMCMSVLEHLWDPLAALRDFRRILAPGGVCLLNVPTWRGKWFLEYSAFRLKTSPPQEMDDHKMYYDLRDLWPLLVQAGFLPHQIQCYRHKFGLNLFAACRLS
jgi:SAM-dependent methyltransferase